jgi:hypothetical protein
MKTTAVIQRPLVGEHRCPHLSRRAPPPGIFSGPSTIETPAPKKAHFPSQPVDLTRSHIHHLIDRKPHHPSLGHAIIATLGAHWELRHCVVPSPSPTPTSAPKKAHFPSQVPDLITSNTNHITPETPEPPGPIRSIRPFNDENPLKINFTPPQPQRVQNQPCFTCRPNPKQHAFGIRRTALLPLEHSIFNFQPSTKTQTQTPKSTLSVASR